MTETIDKATGEVFALEPSEPGVVPPRVIEELRRGFREAKDYADAFGEAVKAQAEKHGIKLKALRRYIAALESDKLDEEAAVAADLERLIEAG
jgi:hypothetical protein